MKLLPPLLFALTLAALSDRASSAQNPGTSLTTLGETKLLAPGGKAGDQFGQYVAYHGDTAAIAAPFHRGNHPVTGKFYFGSVFVFVRSGAQWIFEAEVIPDVPSNSDLFGSSVAIQGDTLVVGAFADSENGHNAGAAYMFVRNNGQWSQQAKLLDPTGAPRHQFGASVAIDGESVLVGAPLELNFGPVSGSAHVFVRSGSAWSYQAKLVSSAPGTVQDYFGSSVGISGDRAIVGAFVADGVVPFTGAAYAFERNGGNWSQGQELVASDGQAGDLFGWSVAISGDHAIAGAWGKDNDAGAAYFFAHDGVSWNPQIELSTPEVDFFGYKVALDDKTALVDAPTALPAGAVYVYVLGANAWTVEAKLRPASVGPEHSFGSDIAIDANTVVVGDLSDGLNGTLSGSASVFLLLRDPVTYCTAKTNSCGTTPTIGYAGVPSATLTAGFVVQAANTKALKAGLLLYSDAAAPQPPPTFQGGSLCVGSPVKRSIPVVDSSGTTGQCDGMLAIDMNTFASGSLGGNPLESLSVPSTSIHCQFWGRDAPGSSLLSDALVYVVGL